MSPDAKPPEVTMYSTGWCPYCDRARGLLQRKGIAVTEIKVDEDAAQRDAMLKRSGGRRTVPQIFIKGKFVGGSDIITEMYERGELQDALK